MDYKPSDLFDTSQIDNPELRKVIEDSLKVIADTKVGQKMFESISNKLNDPNYEDGAFLDGKVVLTTDQSEGSFAFEDYDNQHMVININVHDLNTTRFLGSKGEEIKDDFASLFIHEITHLAEKRDHDNNLEPVSEKHFAMLDALEIQKDTLAQEYDQLVNRTHPALERMSEEERTLLEENLTLHKQKAANNSLSAEQETRLKELDERVEPILANYTDLQNTMKTIEKLQAELEDFEINTLDTIVTSL